MKPLFFLIITTLSLSSCTKQPLESPKVNAVYELSVTQIKTTVSINIKVAPTDHIRVCEVVTVFQRTKVATRFLIPVGTTEVAKVFNVNSTLSSYYLSTLMDYYL